MGALTLTGLIPTIYNAMNVVARERVGFIPAVSRDSRAEQAAVGQTVMSPVVGVMTAEDLAPAPYAADTPNQTIDNVQMTITKARSVPFGITGEETRALQNAGTYGNINEQRITQALRTLCNEMEGDLAAMANKLSRGYGTPGTVPFGTAGDLSDFAQPMKILKDNGAPTGDNHLVLGTGAMANMAGKQSVLFKVNEANSEDLLRNGIIARVQGFDLHESAQIVTPVAGTGATATTNAAGYAKGTRTITLAAAGTGTVVAGDLIKFAGDTNMYMIEVGNGNVSAGGTIKLAAPGLMQALPASAQGITIVAAAPRNAFFNRAAIQLATRAPAMPEGGDSADDIMYVTDPVSGITFEFAVYRQKRQVRYEVNLAWGVAAPNPHLGGVLLG
jgi:hypothetical protein